MILRILDSKLRHKAWWRKWRGLPEPIPLLSAQMAREALRILSGNLTFSASVNRDYESIADGMPIKIRLPGRYLFEYKPGSKPLDD